MQVSNFIFKLVVFITVSATVIGSSNHTHFLENQAEYDAWQAHLTDPDLNWEILTSGEGEHNYGGEFWVLHMMHYPEVYQSVDNPNDIFLRVEYELWHYRDDGTFVFNIYENALPLN